MTEFVNSEKEGDKIKEKTIRLPLTVIREILRHIPREEIEKLQKGFMKKEPKSVSADHLLRLTAIATVGGDAVEDTERIWG